MYMTLKKYLFLLWCGCILGQLAVIPFAQNLAILTNGPFPQELTFGMILIMVLSEGVFVSGLFILLGKRFAQKIGIRFLLLDNTVDKVTTIVKPGFVIGALSTCLQYGVDRLLPNAPLSLHYIATNTPPLYGLIGSLNGLFNQEISMRLFFLSGI